MTTNPSSGEKVVVALSGGVDSSVALLKIVEAGYEAIGITLKLWNAEDPDGNRVNDSYCCSLDAVNNARQVCRALGVPHYTLDFRDEFRRRVVNYFAEEYLAGRTPNPCIACNRDLRWGTLLKQATDLGARWIATGHYARLERDTSGRPVLLRPKDRLKDQTYVLWGVPSEALAHTIFPLWDVTKEEVRRVAADRGFVTASISDSQELCFVPDNDYRAFLQSYRSAETASEPLGKILDLQGKSLGSHRGISRYTVGQRRGLGLSSREPLYVREIRTADQAIVVAPRPQMNFSGCTLSQVHWLVNPSDFPTLAVQIRYRHAPVGCSLVPLGRDQWTVSFETPQFAAAPGQSAVFYSGDRVIGGGVIERGVENGLPS